jgi:Na+/glutamate symporter
MRFFNYHHAERIAVTAAAVGLFAGAAVGLPVMAHANTSPAGPHAAITVHHAPAR